jgi:hypothetical protein
VAEKGRRRKLATVAEHPMLAAEVMEEVTTAGAALLKLAKRSHAATVGVYCMVKGLTEILEDDARRAATDPGLTDAIIRRQMRSLGIALAQKEKEPTR